MLKRGWMARYLPAIVKENVASCVLIAWGYVWSAAVFGLAILNLVVALGFGVRVWSWYTSFVPISVQLGLFLIQYVSLRAMVTRSIRARMSAAPAE